MSDLPDAVVQIDQSPSERQAHAGGEAIGSTSAGAAPGGSSSVSEERFLWALTAEHAALQAARGSTIYETNGRMTQYLSTVSGALIALGFVGQVSSLGDAFYAFSLTLLPALCLLGLLTYLRCLDSAAEDLYYGQAIARIRQYYRQLDVAAEQHLLLSGHDDPAGVLANMGLAHTRWHVLSHSATMVLAVVAILAGASAAVVAVVWAGPSVTAAASVGVAVATGVAAALFRHQARRWRIAESTVVPASPSPPAPLATRPRRAGTVGGHGA